jgi:hypothetical protein
VAGTLIAHYINALAHFCKGTVMWAPVKSHGHTCVGFSLRPVEAMRRVRTSSSGQLSLSGGGAAAAIASSEVEAGGDDNPERRALRDVYAPMLLAALESVLQARRAAAAFEEVRTSVHTLLHCLVDALGRDLLAQLPAIVDACATAASARNLVEFTRFLTQVCC